MLGMPNVPNQLADDIDALKALVGEQPALANRLETQNAHLDAKVLSLRKQLYPALAHRYAGSSEKLSPDQVYLFDEADADALTGTDDEAGVYETIEVTAQL